MDKLFETDAGLAMAVTSENTLNQLVGQHYSELAGRARGLLRGERRNHPLQTSGLIHEAYMRMLDLYSIDWCDQRRFLSIAAGIMRRVLIDHARNSKATKRGGHLQRVPFNDEMMVVHVSTDALDLDRALARLAEYDPVQAQIVQHRFFGGLTVEQTGYVLAMSPASVKRKWTVAKAWLHRELNETCGAR